MYVTGFFQTKTKILEGKTKRTYGTDLACEKIGWLVFEFLEKITRLFF